MSIYIPGTDSQWRFIVLSSLFGGVGIVVAFIVGIVVLDRLGF